ncbi:MAG: hypothetical protein JHC23_06175 [Sulfolobus sp.]|nr:hypothetical protein [Sulfolobus sp.]
MIVFLALGYPYLNASFVQHSIDQPMREISELQNLQYTASVIPRNMSIVMHLYNPTDFPMVVLNVTAPGAKSLEPVTIMPKSNGTVVMKIYDYQELYYAYVNNDFHINVALRFLNTTVLVRGS